VEQKEGVEFLTLCAGRTAHVHLGSGNIIPADLIGAPDAPPPVVAGLATAAACSLSSVA